MNAYELLGIERNAALDEIKQAYRRLAKGLHPDVNAGDSEAAERFKAVTAAYNLLADAKKRVEYDRTQRQHDPGGRRRTGKRAAPGSISKSTKPPANASSICMATWPEGVSAGCRALPPPR